jgi:DivIVA domain-containing protein
VFWLILVVIVLVVGAAALVALGGGGSLPEAEQDRLAARLPLDRPLNRADVDGLRFPMGLRGYRMDEVDDVLDRLGAELSHRDVRIAELETALAAALDAPQPGRATATAPASGSGSAAASAPAAPKPAASGPAASGPGASGPDAGPQDPSSGAEQQ